MKTKSEIVTEKLNQLIHDGVVQIYNGCLDSVGEDSIFPRWLPESSKGKIELAVDKAWEINR